MAEQQDSREELYRRFRNEALTVGIGGLFYDENDLLDIYSYAQDENDDFVRVEALMLASRLFPSSDAFAARKTLFYRDIAMTDEPRQMSRSVIGRDIYSRLARVQLADNDDNGKLTRELSAILSDAESLNEDDIILMSEIAMENDETDWLLKNRKEIVAKAEYAPTFFYEIALCSFEEGEFGRAMEMAEELVDLEPMNGEFWELYADIALSASDAEKALSAADFALAIDPGSWKAWSLKGQALFHLDRDIPEATRLLEKALHASPDVTYHVPLVLALIYQETPEKAAAVMRYYLDNVQLSREVVVTLAMLSEEEAMTYLDRYIGRALSFGEGYFTDWARELVAQVSVGFAADMLVAYDRLTASETKSGPFYDMMFELLYRAGRYELVVSLMNRQEYVFFAPVAEIAKIMSYIRLDEKQKALEDARINLKVLQTFYESDMPMPSYAYKIQSRYLKDTMKRFVDALSAPKLPLEKDFNPFL